LKDQAQIVALFNKYLSNEFSFEEVEELMKYFSSDQGNALEEKILEHLQSPVLQKQDDSVLHPRVFEGIKAKIAKGRPVTRKLWPRIAIVAALMVVIFGAGLFYINQRPSTVAQRVVHKKEIKPAANKAFLTLADGKRIALNDLTNGSVAVQSNVKITKTVNGQLVYVIAESNAVSPSTTTLYNTIETPRGGRYEIFLPDGTHVWMNAASTLKYPTSFASLKERKVDLQGEAYFEVAKDKKHPFIVKTSQQEVRVLGTHFNINAYADNNQSQTTLLEGSVRVLGATNQLYLKPGQMAVINYNERMLSLKQANLENVMAWKNGLFVFDRQQLSDVLKDVSRWYNVEFEYSEEIGRRKLWGVVSKNGTLAELLDNIFITSSIHYKIEGRRVKLTN
jgi:transmembrane sensor